MRHDLILHDRECRGYSSGCEVGREGIEAHREKNGIATAETPVKRVGWAL